MLDETRLTENLDLYIRTRGHFKSSLPIYH
jgi:hypothetical protein